MTEATLTTQTPTAAPDTGTAATQAPQGAQTQGKGTQTPEQVAASARAMELVIRGQKMNLNLDDPNDLNRLRSMAQKGESADQKFAEAHAVRSQAEDFLRLLKTNPEAVLANPAIGLDVRQWAEKFLYERLQEEKLSPEQKESRRMKTELEEYKRRESEASEARKQKEFEAAKESYKGKLTEEIITVLSESQLPKSPKTVARMAHYILEAKKRGWNDVSPRDVVDMVWQDYIDEHNELYGSLPGEKLAQIMNENIRTKLREIDLAKMKSPASKVSAKDQPPSNPDKEKNDRTKAISKDEWRDQLNKKLGAIDL